MLRNKGRPNRKDLYTDNYMTSMKEIEEDRNKWKDFSCSWI